VAALLFQLLPLLHPLSMVVLLRRRRRRRWRLGPWQGVGRGRRGGAAAAVWTRPQPHPVCTIELK
jgi:hypothetical protein